MPSLKEVLDDWYKRATVTQEAHYLSADHFAYWSRWLGIPVIVLSAIAGTSVFATLQKQPDVSVQIAVGLCSVAAAVLAGLQTFLEYSERAERHRVAGAKYGAVGRGAGGPARIPRGAFQSSHRGRTQKVRRSCA